MSGNTNSGRVTSPIESQEDKVSEEIKVPDQLHGESLSYWKRVIKILLERGAFTDGDFFALERLALLYGEWKKLESVVLSKGMTYEAETDRGSYVIRERPEAKLILNINKEIKDFERRFGLTPLDRTNIKRTIKPYGSIRNKY